MAPRLPLMVAAAVIFLAATACARGGSEAGVVAIAVNQDAEAQPRLAFYAGVPGQDSFILPAGNYELTAMDMAGGLVTQSLTVIGGEDVASEVLATLDMPTPSEEAGRRNREAMRNLLLFFARLNGAQLGLEELLTDGHTRPAPASPDDLGSTQILGEERPQGRLLGIRDWETEMASWGRILELGLRAIQAELPSGLLDGRNSPFADAATLVREWRDGTAVDRRAFLEVVGQMSAQRRTEIHQMIVGVFGNPLRESPTEFYLRVEAGELDRDAWTMANFVYENDRPADGVSYGEIARSQGLEPSRPYFDRWLRQSSSAWGFLWSVSAETAKRAHLPTEVLAVARQEAATASLAGRDLRMGLP